MTPNTKRGLTMGICVVVIAVCCTWIYRTQFHAAKFNVGLHQRTGEVLAEQTVKLIGNKGTVVTLAIEPKEWPELKTQLDAYHAALNKLGDFEVRNYFMDTKDQPKYSVGSGLSGRRYVRLANRFTNADVLVSFVGAPHLKKDDLAELTGKPKFIVEARSTANLAKMFEKSLISVAIVSRFHFPAPGAIEPNTPDEWFTKRYEIVTPETAAGLPQAPPESE